MLFTKFDVLHKNIDIVFAVVAWMISTGGVISFFVIDETQMSNAARMYLAVWFVFVVLTFIFRPRPYRSISWVLGSAWPLIFIAIMYFLIKSRLPWKWGA